MLIKLNNFIKGNTYVFTKEKFLEDIGKAKFNPWIDLISGCEVEIVDEFRGMVNGYLVVPDWCKCIKEGAKDE